MRRPARRQKWARVSRQASCGTSIKPLRLELQTLYAAGSLTCFVFICHIRTLSSALSEAHGTGGVRAETETVKGRVRRGRRGSPTSLYGAAGAVQSLCSKYVLPTSCTPPTEIPRYGCRGTRHGMTLGVCEDAAGCGCTQCAVINPVPHHQSRSV